MWCAPWAAPCSRWHGAGHGVVCCQDVTWLLFPLFVNSLSNYLLWGHWVAFDKPVRCSAHGCSFMRNAQKSTPLLDEPVRGSAHGRPFMRNAQKSALPMGVLLCKMLKRAPFSLSFLPWFTQDWDEWSDFKYLYHLASWWIRGLWGLVIVSVTELWLHKPGVLLSLIPGGYWPFLFPLFHLMTCNMHAGCMLERVSLYYSKVLYIIVKK